MLIRILADATRCRIQAGSCLFVCDEAPVCSGVRAVSAAIPVWAAQPSTRLGPANRTEAGLIEGTVADEVSACRVSIAYGRGQGCFVRDHGIPGCPGKVCEPQVTSGCAIGRTRVVIPQPTSGLWTEIA